MGEGDLAEVEQVEVFKKKDKDLLCPRCLSKGKYNIMTKKTNYGITIDKCESCGGIFLDKGEQSKKIKKINKGGK